MNSEKLSLRLETVAQKVLNYQKAPIHLVDIGSDHAYLPCHLVKIHGVTQAIAGEVVQGPYESAQQEVARLQLQDFVHVRKGDGLSILTDEDQYNVITICGMGGALIRDILNKESKRLHSNIVLVLQPNNASHLLRQWLNEHQFNIVDEVVVEDNKRYYEIIVAKYSEEQLKKMTRQEMLFGEFNLKQSTEEFKKKWMQELLIQKRILEQLQKNKTDFAKQTMIKEKITDIEEVIQ